MQRRDFLKHSAAAAGAYAGIDLFGYAMPNAEAFGSGEGIDVEEGLYYIDEGKEKNTAPEIRPEIRDNPRAVFIIETGVDALRDARGFYTGARSQLEAAGKAAVPHIFVRGAKRGGSTIVRPNFTDVPDSVLSPVYGGNTSPDFIAGFVEGLRELGNTNIIAGSRGASAANHRKTGIYDVFDRHGILLVEAKYKRFSHYRKKDLNWHRVPGKPVVWKTIPTYRPIGDEDNFFINMPKLKCHNLGLTTLALKNLQGTVPVGYGHYCNAWGAMEFLCKRSYDIDFNRHFVKDYYQNVEAAFLKHRAAGYKYWDYEGMYPIYEKAGGWEKFRRVKDNPDDLMEFMSVFPAKFTMSMGKSFSIPRLLMWDEQWCQRAIDSAAAIRPDINIIEGVIGRDGSGFDTGRDELCNYILVGLSMVETDAVGSYLMGHDPRELYYTRIAKERGVGECDPEKIDIYRIGDKGDITPVKNIAELRRYRLGVNLHTWAETGERLFW